MRDGPWNESELASFVRTKKIAFVLYGLLQARIRQVVVIAHDADGIPAAVHAAVGADRSASLSLVQMAVVPLPMPKVYDPEILCASGPLNLLTTGHYLVQMEEQFQPGLSSGYAVMTRIWVVDHWTWATWMCFDTYGRAVAHARKGDKVVRLASTAWKTLKHQESAAQPEQSDTASPVPTTGRPTLPSRAEGEPFVDFVLRLLNTLDPAGTIPGEGQEGDRSASESDKQTSKIETPAFVARLILSRLSKSEIGKLDRMLDEDLPALLDALRGRSHIVAKRRGRYQ